MKGLKNIGEPEGKNSLRTMGVRVNYILAYDLKKDEILGIIDLAIISDKKKDLEIMSLRSEFDVWILTLRNTVEKLYSFENSEKIIDRCIFVGDRESDFFDLLHELNDLKMKGIKNEIPYKNSAIPLLSIFVG